MVSLFASSSSSSGGQKKRPRPPTATTTTTAADADEVRAPPSQAEEPPAAAEAAEALAAAAAPGQVKEVAVDESKEFLSEASWADMGLAPWVLKACRAMGFKRPTPVQARCIPAVLAGRDVLGCAETGSGKTAAFALPMLDRLSEDPYGVFGVILTPTRELAIQIAEQFAALGAPLGLRHAVVIGGVAMVDQAVELAKRPHVVIATPGRLWDHLRGPCPPDLSKARYLVLDEADRLLYEGFEAHLGAILQAMTAPRRQTLLFSATMTTSLEELKSLTKVQPVLFDLTRARALPQSLLQQYLFMPAQVKTCYLVDLLQKLLLRNAQQQQQQQRQQGEGAGTGARAGSAIVFVGTCQRYVRFAGRCAGALFWPVNAHCRNPTHRHTNTAARRSQRCCWRRASPPSACTRSCRRSAAWPRWASSSPRSCASLSARTWPRAGWTSPWWTWWSITTCRACLATTCTGSGARLGASGVRVGWCWC